MTIVTANEDLRRLCNGLSSAEFIAIDTEFLRERTYYPELCLIQLAGPDKKAFAVDPLARDIDLQPVLDLLFDPKILKVFHAGRQDLEIFYHMTGKIPHPVFDTQIAAMVCGYGESVGYVNLVGDITGHQVDKGSQFTDWSRRPLTKRQTDYALDDVIHLVDVYRHLARELEKDGRQSWVEEEVEILTSDKTYANAPEDCWKRIKIRSDKPRVLATLRELAAWREKEAQRRNVPRGRVIRDETLAEIAMHMPDDAGELARTRGLPEGMANGGAGRTMLELIARVKAMPPDQYPRLPPRKALPHDLVPLTEMLRMLLRICCAESGVAPKLVAAQDDIDLLAMNDMADIPAMHGWRREIFGEKALNLKAGRLALAYKDGKIQKLER